MDFGDQASLEDSVARMPFVEGAPTSLGTVIHKVAAEQFWNNVNTGLSIRESGLYADQWKAARKYGVDLQSYSDYLADRGVPYSLPKSVYDWQDMGGGRRAWAEEYNAKVDKLNKANGTAFSTVDALNATLAKDSERYRQEAAKAMRLDPNMGFFGKAALFGTAVGVSLTDPVNLATLPIGGALGEGGAIAKQILSQAALMSALSLAESAQQAGAEEQLGIKVTGEDVAKRALISGAIGGTLGLGFGVLGKILGKSPEAIAQQVEKDGAEAVVQEAQRGIEAMSEGKAIALAKDAGLPGENFAMKSDEADRAVQQANPWAAYESPTASKRPEFITPVSGEPVSHQLSVEKVADTLRTKLSLLPEDQRDIVTALKRQLRGEMKTPEIVFNALKKGGGKLSKAAMADLEAALHAVEEKYPDLKHFDFLSERPAAASVAESEGVAMPMAVLEKIDRRSRIDRTLAGIELPSGNRVALAGQSWAETHAEFAKQFYGAFGADYDLLAEKAHWENVQATEKFLTQGGELNLPHDPWPISGVDASQVDAETYAKVSRLWREMMDAKAEYAAEARTAALEAGTPLVDQPMADLPPGISPGQYGDSAVFDAVPAVQLTTPALAIPPDAAPSAPPSGEVPMSLVRSIEENKAAIDAHLADVASASAESKAFAENVGKDFEKASASLKRQLDALTFCVRTKP
jgi:hypothetical protein